MFAGRLCRFPKIDRRTRAVSWCVRRGQPIPAFWAAGIICVAFRCRPRNTAQRRTPRPPVGPPIHDAQFHIFNFGDPPMRTTIQHFWAVLVGWLDIIEGSTVKPFAKPLRIVAPRTPNPNPAYTVQDQTPKAKDLFREHQITDLTSVVGVPTTASPSRPAGWSQPARSPACIDAETNKASLTTMRSAVYVRKATSDEAFHHHHEPHHWFLYHRPTQHTRQQLKRSQSCQLEGRNWI
jgi:hypothetical protein